MSRRPFLSLILLLIFCTPTLAQSVVVCQNNSVAGQGCVNNQLMTDFDGNGQFMPFIVKSVGYAPTPIGRYPTDWTYEFPASNAPDNYLDDPAILNRDFPLIAAMNANSIRIWAGNDRQVTQADINDLQSEWYQDFASLNRIPTRITQQTLDLAEANGLKVIAGFDMPAPGFLTCTENGSEYIFFENADGFRYADYTNADVRARILNDFEQYVQTFKDHPAILFWAIGNEINQKLNGDPAMFRAYYSLVNQMAAAAKTIEGENAHPVAVVDADIGHINDANLGTRDADLPAIDIWGANVYRGETFTNLFAEFAALSSKALWISEFGIDAYQTDFDASTDKVNPEVGVENQQLQADWNSGLWDVITVATAQTIGGSVMEYSDEWWKPFEFLCGGDSRFCNAQQNHFGFGPLDTDCPVDGVIDFTPAFPDEYFDEEWFGLVGVQLNSNFTSPNIVNPRLAYSEMQTHFQQPTLAVNLTSDDVAVGESFDLIASATTDLGIKSLFWYVQGKNDFQPFIIGTIDGGEANLAQLQDLWAGFNQNTFILQRQLVVNQPGEYYLHMFMIDQAYPGADLIHHGYKRLEFSVSATNNSAPEFYPLNTQFQVSVGESLNIPISAFDIDGDAITLDMQPQLNGASFENVTVILDQSGTSQLSGGFNWSPTSADIGIQTIQFILRDDFGNQTQSVPGNITVTGSNALPQVLAIFPVNDQFLIWFGFDEEDRYAIEYAYRIDGGPWSAYSPFRFLDFTQLGLVSGQYTIEVRARDSAGQESLPLAVNFEIL